VGYNFQNFFANNTSLSSFAQPLLPSKSAKSREIPRKFELIAGLGQSRSSTLVLQRNFLLVINSNYGENSRMSEKGPHGGNADMIKELSLDKDVVEMVKSRCLKYFGHVVRIDNQR